MLIALWIINILLAIAQLGAGGMKVIKSKAALKEAGLGWVDDFSAGSVKLIGLAEVLGAIGLILPVALNIAPILAPIAAVGLTILMIGAVAVHARRKEPVAVPLVLTLLGIASAVIGFIAL